MWWETITLMSQHRVRAILVTRDDKLLTIQRIKPGRPPYWVLPGGGVDPSDATLEDALHREIREELAGQPDIHALVDIIDGPEDRQYIYLARIHHYDFARRSGPEFAEPGRGTYQLQAVPLTRTALTAITLVPSQVADLLTRCLDTEGDLFTLPDRRTPAGLVS
jgi:8-oxo-dGTP pyrophosphatase MutT (NUDIX family)